MVRCDEGRAQGADVFVGTQQLYALFEVYNDRIEVGGLACWTVESTGVGGEGLPKRCVFLVGVTSENFTAQNFAFTVSWRAPQRFSV